MRKVYINTSIGVGPILRSHIHTHKNAPIPTTDTNAVCVQCVECVQCLCPDKETDNREYNGDTKAG